MGRDADMIVELLQGDSPVDASNPLAVTLASSSVAGASVVVQDEFTRPVNATAYAANDVVGDGAVITFPNAAAAAAGSGNILRARLITDLSTITARFRLHLYDTAPTPIADNAAFTMLFANRAIRIGVVDFPAVAIKGGTGSDAVEAEKTDLRLTFQLPSGRDLYGVLETLDIFTPTPGQKFLVELGILQG